MKLSSGNRRSRIPAYGVTGCGGSSGIPGAWERAAALSIPWRRREVSLCGNGVPDIGHQLCAVYNVKFRHTQRFPKCSCLGRSTVGFSGEEELPGIRSRRPYVSCGSREWSFKEIFGVQHWKDNRGWKQKLPTFASSRIWEKHCIKECRSLEYTWYEPDCGSSTERLNGISRARRMSAFWQLAARVCRSSEVPISGIMRREQLEVAWKDLSGTECLPLHSLDIVQFIG